MVQIKQTQCFSRDLEKEAVGEEMLKFEVASASTRTQKILYKNVQISNYCKYINC